MVIIFRFFSLYKQVVIILDEAVALAGGYYFKFAAA
jgi:hypothetical protein